MSRYPAYPAYKDSGIESLGQIPVDWKVKRLKFLLSQPLKYGANESAELDDPELPRYIRITDVKNDGSLREDTFRSLPVEVAKDYLLDEGDILLARSGATVGKTFIYRKSWGTAAYAGYLIRARLSPELNHDFAYHFLQSNPYWEWLNSVFIQATIQNVSAEKYANLWIPVPPSFEQQAIVRFLDKKTAVLDSLIAKKETLLQKLAEKRTALISQCVTKGLDPTAPLKDSGIPWLGQIPAHWEASKLKYETEIVSKGTTPSTLGKGLSDGGIRFIKAENIQEGKISNLPEFFIDEETDVLLKRSRLWPNDVLIVIAGATTGKSAIILNDMLPANTNQAVCFIRLKNKKYSSLLSPWISTGFIQDLIWNTAVQSAQPNLAMEDVKSFPCLMPPKEEIEEIKLYLEQVITKFDALIIKMNSAISKLKEYRTALITNAVTGKIDVRYFSQNEGILALAFPKNKQ